MIASIETRFDDEYRAILIGFVYVHRHRISHQDSFQIIKVAAEHLVYQSDIKSEYLEQQIQLLHYSKLLLESIAKAEVEKRALPTPLDLHRALLSEPECFDYISKLIKLNSSNYSANFCICWEAFSKLKIIIHHHSSSFIKNILRWTMRQERWLCPLNQTYFQTCFWEFLKKTSPFCGRCAKLRSLALPLWACMIFGKIRLKLVLKLKEIAF